MKLVFLLQKQQQITTLIWINSTETQNKSHYIITESPTNQPINQPTNSTTLHPIPSTCISQQQKSMATKQTTNLARGQTHLHCCHHHHEHHHCTADERALGSVVMLLAAAAAANHDEVDGHEDEETQHHDDWDDCPYYYSLEEAGGKVYVMPMVSLRKVECDIFFITEKEKINK